MRRVARTVDTFPSVRASPPSSRDFQFAGSCEARRPLAGTVHNTDTLLGHDGFVSIKTCSDAAGGCFAFRAIHWIDGKPTTITGVVSGQPGADRVAAGLTAAAAIVDRITGRRAVPDSPHLTPTPGALPGAYAPQRTGVDATRTREEKTPAAGPPFDDRHVGGGRRRLWRHQ